MTTLSRMKKEARCLGKRVANMGVDLMETERKMLLKTERSIAKKLGLRPARVLGLPKWAAFTLGAVASTGIVLGSMKVARTMM
ncbi:MAG TPA: hypothetical protein VGM92_00700 [Candidatus Kapabacteria bacterium]